MSVRFLRAARAEFDEAAQLYESTAPRLAQAFRADVVEKLQLIASYPRSSQELTRNIRRATLRRFPFLIIYTHVGSDIVVLAVAHMRRRPRTWRNRLEGA